MMIRDDQRMSVPEGVLHRALDGEVVLLDLGEGKYYSLDAVGAEAWEIMASGTTFGQLITKLLARFEVDEPTLRVDIAELVGQLVERHLVIVE